MSKYHEVSCYLLIDPSVQPDTLIFLTPRNLCVTFTQVINPYHDACVKDVIEWPQQKRGSGTFV